MARVERTNKVYNLVACKSRSGFKEQLEFIILWLGGSPVRGQSQSSKKEFVRDSFEMTSFPTVHVLLR